MHLSRISGEIDWLSLRRFSILHILLVDWFTTNLSNSHFRQSVHISTMPTSIPMKSISVTDIYKLLRSVIVVLVIARSQDVQLSQSMADSERLQNTSEIE